jgi:hypothetical protein
MAAGVAFSEAGVARAGMGVDAADYDDSGRPSLIIGNFSNEMMALYHNEGTGLFIDEAPMTTQVIARVVPRLPNGTGEADRIPEATDGRNRTPRNTPLRFPAVAENPLRCSEGLPPLAPDRRGNPLGGRFSSCSENPEPDRSRSRRIAAGSALP